MVKHSTHQRKLHLQRRLPRCSPAWGGGWQEPWQLERLGRKQEVGPGRKRSKVERDKEAPTLRCHLRGAEPGSSARVMATEATQAATVAPRSGAGGLEPWQALGPPQPGHTSLAQTAAPPGRLPPDWRHTKPRKRSILLRGVGAAQVAIAALHLFLGGYLAFAAKSLHLVMMKSWYPFWGGASFLISGVLAITMDMVSKPSVKVLCLTGNTISCFCVLAGLFVMAKDLFLESLFESPGTQVHIQELELALLCLTCLEPFLPGSLAIIACRDSCLSAEKEDLSLIPDTSLEFRGPPPSYEDVTRGGTWAEPRQR
ncbi:membrane-spanning 4-domains subfamily A member 10 isoform 3-T3 [Molossus nigricans]